MSDLLTSPQVISDHRSFQADHLFLSSIWGYICHLRGSQGGQRSLQESSSQASKSNA